MRIKTFLIVCGCVLITSYILIIFTSSEQQNDSIKNIMSQTNLHIKEIQVSAAYRHTNARNFDGRSSH